MIYCNEWKTEKRHERTNVAKVKQLELWLQLYGTYTCHHNSSGMYEISGRLIFVEQSVLSDNLAHVQSCWRHFAVFWFYMHYVSIWTTILHYNKLTFIHNLHAYENIKLCDPLTTYGIVNTSLYVTWQQSVNGSTSVSLWLILLDLQIYTNIYNHWHQPTLEAEIF